MAGLPLGVLCIPGCRGPGPPLPGLGTQALWFLPALSAPACGPPPYPAPLRAGCGPWSGAAVARVKLLRPLRASRQR